jgi:hypothetical protein
VLEVEEAEEHVLLSILLNVEQGIGYFDGFLWFISLS